MFPPLAQPEAGLRAIPASSLPTIPVVVSAAVDTASVVPETAPAAVGTAVDYEVFGPAFVVENLAGHSQVQGPPHFLCSARWPAACPRPPAAEDGR